MCSSQASCNAVERNSVSLCHLLTRPTGWSWLRQSALAAQQIGLHLLVSLNLDGAAPLENEALGKPHEASMGHLDLIRNAARFHGACGINGIAPDIIGKFVRPDDPRHNIAAVKTDPDLEVLVILLGDFTDCVPHGEREASDRLWVIVAWL